MTEVYNDIYPLALLMDELKHDDVTNRVEAMQKLDTIALALGPDRTRDELIPFLQEVAQDDEDEVFTILAEQLGHFVPLVGGQEHAQILIPALKTLAGTEEPIVRDKAVESLNNIASQLSVSQINEFFYPLIEDLASNEWFSSKVSATGLFQNIITKVDPERRKNLLVFYFKLITDDSGPMVKRAAGSHLPQIIDLFREEENSSNEQDWDLISSMFQSLTHDKQDSVKFLSVDTLIAILKFFHSKNDKSHNKALLESALDLIKDPSWRVRYMSADRYEQLAENFAEDENDLSQLTDSFSALLKDNEGEVRKAIAKQLSGFSKLIDQKVLLSTIIPQVDELSNDPSELVRSALAGEITGLTPLLEKEDAINHLLPIFLTMLKDEFPEVKLNIISKLSIVNQVIGIESLSASLLPAISELAKDKQWRVRLAIIQYTPLLAEQLGVEFFDEELGALVLSWLWDSVYSIREAAVNSIKELAKIFGSKWADEEVISKILEKDSNFVHRITCLFTLTNLIGVVTKEIATKRILPFIDNLVTDEVPNIRFNVAKSYLLASKALLDKEQSSEELDLESTIKYIKDSILPKVEILQHDKDADVKYFANESYKGITQLWES